MAIGRASNYGPGGLASVTGARLFRAAVAGRPSAGSGCPTSPTPSATWRTWPSAWPPSATTTGPTARSGTLPAAEPLTGRQFLELVVAASGGCSRITTNSAAMTRLAGVFVPMIREVGEVLYEFQAPYVVDWSKFGQVFGPFTPTPHAEAVA